MFKTFRHWFLFLAVCAAVVPAVAALSSRPAAAQDEARHEVRMGVDFTVLPVVLPDGTEAPATPAEPPLDQPETVPAPEAAGPAPDAPQPDQQAKDAAAGQAEIPALAPVGGEGVIRAVTLDETALGFSITVVADRPVGEASIMHLDNPIRLVVDLPGAWRYRGGNVLRSEGAVKHLVLGEHPDRFRMVVHFRTPPKKRLEPDLQTAGNELHVLVAVP
ncbi:hypothetical protein DND132_2553 [Pseudodesulfovibrio mercurii]|uniref:AMIN domain-containing protein n=1 Tax=Pseudodesulfovibrio mercurii TaxID=641491 RepID=F0JD82_9BACT|nr:AMIN domain-containing protein [Pseudodesulfovibrio mercurii]EGB15756.1 hypothetical protein DND132_2553 [Pseudodesulfovibrio mercurii]